MRCNSLGRDTNIIGILWGYELNNNIKTFIDEKMSLMEKGEYRMMKVTIVGYLFCLIIKPLLVVFNSFLSHRIILHQTVARHLNQIDSRV